MVSAKFETTKMTNNLPNFIVKFLTHKMSMLAAVESAVSCPMGFRGRQGRRRRGFGESAKMWPFLQQKDCIRGRRAAEERQAEDPDLRPEQAARPAAGAEANPAESGIQGVPRPERAGPAI